jgi:hypothetical protein
VEFAGKGLVGVSPFDPATPEIRQAFTQIDSRRELTFLVTCGIRESPATSAIPVAPFGQFSAQSPPSAPMRPAVSRSGAQN